MRFFAFIFLSSIFLSHSLAQEHISNKQALTGFVDMHTHPRSDLAFGGELFYGKPYGNIAVALNNCSGYHAEWNLKNKQGNIFRAALVEQTEQQYFKAWHDTRQGYPDFASWPSWCAVLHQQMWVDWIERAHQGGLNIMVALATHSHCMADAAETTGPRDDQTVMLNNIQGIKELVANSSFMEIALTPQDVRTIVAKGKLAVILGIEMDNIGNFYSPADQTISTIFNPNPSEKEIKDELDKIWNLGIRYIFPVHITNNIFGGTALYVPAFNVANKYNTGDEFIPETVSTKETDIAFRLTHPILTMNPEAELLAKIVLRLSGGILPEHINPSRKKNYTFWDTIPVPGQGHRNSLGLTAKGKFAVAYMMQKGYLIDIDHMGDKTAGTVLEMALNYNYPVNSGHNHPRETPDAEGSRTIKQYTQIKQTGGMVGLGHAEGAEKFVRHYKYVLNVMDYKNVAIGTDVNGFYALPPPNPNIKVDYDTNFTRCTTGNRTWDINLDGFAHYGLFPDYIKSWEAAGLSVSEKNVFMSSAEHFTQMWEKCETNKNKIGQ